MLAYLQVGLYHLPHSCDTTLHSQLTGIKANHEWKNMVFRLYQSFFQKYLINVHRCNANWERSAFILTALTEASQHLKDNNPRSC